ncbi:MAG: SH3 domain-containing protein [Cyanobacteria bacterium P01_A01_bin.135]
MKRLIATTLLLSLLTLPAAANEREGWHRLSAAERLERLMQDRRTLEGLEPRRRFERRSPTRGSSHRSIRVRSPHSRIILRDQSYSGHGIDERGIVILEPDRTVIIRQRDRDERRDVIQVSPQQPIYAAPQPQVVRRQQQMPRLLHGRRISPFLAQIYAPGTLSGHAGPSTVYPVITRFTPSQVVTATQSAGSADGRQWYLVTSAQGQYAWVRGDRLVTQSR